MIERNKIETSQDKYGSQQAASQEPQRWLLGRETPANCPPKAAEE
jgi:hypothetical protein